MQELSKAHLRWGFDKMYAYLKNAGYAWNHKRVRRLYCELQLNLRIKPKKRFPKRSPKALLQPLHKNVCWSIDFMTDALKSGIKFRTLNVLDDYNRQGIGIKPAFSFRAINVTSQLDEWAQMQGYPKRIRVDNGPEFISNHFKQWAKKRGIVIHYIQPGKPAQNAFIERFNRTYREDILDTHLFSSLEEVTHISCEWLYKYNYVRPHQSLQQLSPMHFANLRESRLKKSNKEHSE